MFFDRNINEYYTALRSKSIIFLALQIPLFHSQEALFSVQFFSPNESLKTWLIFPFEWPHQKQIQHASIDCTE